jgi:hypothetical protein
MGRGCLRTGSPLVRGNGQGDRDFDEVAGGARHVLFCQSLPAPDVDLAAGDVDPVCRVAGDWAGDLLQLRAEADAGIGSSTSHGLDPLASTPVYRTHVVAEENIFSELIDHEYCRTVIHRTAPPLLADHIDCRGCDRGRRKECF